MAHTPYYDHKLGVSALQHRCVTGKYNSVFYVINNGNQAAENLGAKDFLNLIAGVAGVFLYFYIVCILMALFIDVSQSSYSDVHAFNIGKVMFANGRIIFLYIFTQHLGNLNNCFKYLMLYLIRICSITNDSNLYKISMDGKHNISFFTKFATLYFYWVVCVNLILLLICNMSLLNPGPRQQKHISIVYHNVRGLIQFKT